MQRSRSWTRRSAVALAGAGLIAGLMGSHVATAATDGMATNSGNPYDPANGHPYRHGAVPTQAQNAKMKAWAAGHYSAGSTGPSTLGYGGGVGGVGVTDGVPQVYLVFWGTQWGSPSTNSGGDLTFGNDAAGAAPYVQEMFKQLGTGGELWSGTMTQYCNGVAYGATSCPSGYLRVGMPTNGVLSGVWYDNSAAQPVPASANLLAQEAVDAANHFSSTPGFNARLAQFDILSPSGAEPDNFNRPLQWCAWHDYTGDGYTGLTGDTLGNLAFTNMPYVLDAGASCGQGFVNGSAGTLDGFSIVNGHEYAETVTDQFPAGGWTNLQNNSNNGEENGDECAWINPGTAGGAADVAMGTNRFAMQSTWSNDTNNCAISHANVSAGPGPDKVTVNNPGNLSSSYGHRVSYQMSGSDTAGLPLTYSASGLPRGLSISTSGRISGTPNLRGTFNVTVTARDSTPASGSTSFTWTIR